MVWAWKTNMQTPFSLFYVTLIWKLDRERAGTEKYKMAAITSSNSKFQNSRTFYKVYILKIICAKFHQNRSSRLRCSADTDRQTRTYARTYARTHTLGSIATFEYKIAKGDGNIFSHLTFFSILTFFATLTGNDASNRLNIIIFVISRSISVEIDTSLALF